MPADFNMCWCRWPGIAGRWLLLWAGIVVIIVMQWIFRHIKERPWKQ